MITTRMTSQITCKVHERGADEILSLNTLAHHISDLNQRDSSCELHPPLDHRPVEELWAGLCKVVSVVVLATPGGPANLRTPGTSSCYIEREGVRVLFEREGDLRNEKKTKKRVINNGVIQP